MKKLLTLVLGTVLLFGNTSCQFFEGFEEQVVTTQDNVKSEYKDTEVLVPIDWMDKDDQEVLKASGKVLVVVDKEALKDPKKSVIEIKKPDSDTLGSIIDVGLDIGKVFFPGLAGLEALGLIFSKRKRKHYGEAIRSLTPYDGNVDLKGAVLSFVRGLGMAHSSVATKETFAEEVAAEKAVEKAESKAG